MSKKIKIGIVLFILLMVIPVTFVLAAITGNNWNQKTFGEGQNSIKDLYQFMSESRQKQKEEDRFAWINMDPKEITGTKWNAVTNSAEIKGLLSKEGFACVGHRTDGSDKSYNAYVYDIFPNTNDANLQSLAKIIYEAAEKFRQNTGEDYDGGQDEGTSGYGYAADDKTKFERKIVRWCIENKSYFGEVDRWAVDPSDYKEMIDGKPVYPELSKEDIEYGKNHADNKFETTSKADVNQKIEERTIDGEQYTFIGPYNLTIKGGKISQINIKLSDKKTLIGTPNGDIYVSLDGRSVTKMDNIKDDKSLAYTNYSGDSFYVVYKGKISGNVEEITIKRQNDAYRARLVFLEATGSGQNNIIYDGEKYVDNASLNLPKAKQYKGNLKVIKVDAKNNIVKLAGVGFYVRNEDTKKYVKIEGNNKEIRYVDSEKEATEFITDKNGEIEINNLIIGTYKAYETKNPNKGYEIVKDGFEKKVEIDKTAELIVENEQKYIKVSGYVFKDVQSQKQSIRNDLYKENDNDDKDQLLAGILVKLKYKGETLKTTETNLEGKYSFNDVEISKLSDYSIEFEYSGLIYENVEIHLDKYNGSKVAEGNLRTEFNNKFTEITKNTKIDNRELEYDEGDHKATLNNAYEFIITANTKKADLDLEKLYQKQNKKDEIENINLGLYEREQPDLAVVKDIENVKLAVNGYEHTYKYASRYKNASEYIDGFNVGVKFGEEYGKQSYSRPVYKADYDYVNSKDKGKELKAYITYKIAIGNNATGLTSKVNSLVDYYDSRYQLVAAGTEINEEDGTIIGTKISHTDSSYNDKYIKTVLNTDLTIDHNKTKYIYVQFSMNRETIFDIIQGKELLDNVAEINSYTTYKTNGNGQLQLYAGVDKNSRPGNATPGDKETYEDDTDKAPALQLEWSEDRKITGTVFEDSVKGEIKAGEERLGNGMYDEGEKTIQGVEVKLVKEDGSVEKSTVTDEKGNFELEGFIPGKYTLVYTWGDETYPVTDYKGTIYVDKERFNHSNETRSWYAENVDTRYSDAIDNYGTRGKIDSGEGITRMDSSTPVMEFGIEWYDTLNIVPDVDKLQFLVKNIDFGIVERPRQKLDISKEVTAIKTITGDNIELVNIIKDKNGEYVGKVTGSDKNFIATPSKGSIQKAILKEEIDDSILNDTTIQIEYKIKVANNSEMDYNTEGYYKYGTDKDERKIVVLKPKGVYDYLDNKMALANTTENGKWVTITAEEYKNKIKIEPTIIDEYLKKYASTTTDPDGLKTEINGFKSYIEKFAGEITVWTRDVTTTIREKIATDKTILYNEDLEAELKTGESKEVKLFTSTKLAQSPDEINLNNSAEITNVERTPEMIIRINPRTSKFFDSGEEVIVTPPTGADHNYVLTIALGVSLLAILGAGVILIKKKVLNK